MNKKLIYLSIFLILALFLVSACQEPISKQLKGGGDVIQLKMDYRCYHTDGRENYYGTCGTRGERGVESCNDAIHMCGRGGGNFAACPPGGKFPFCGG